MGEAKRRTMLGPTGEYPEGVARPGDQGALLLAISAPDSNGNIHMDFGTEVAWRAFCCARLARRTSWSRCECDFDRGTCLEFVSTDHEKLVMTKSHSKLVSRRNVLRGIAATAITAAAKPANAWLEQKVATGGGGTPVNLTAAWVNEGGDKVIQDELRGTASPTAVHNSVWDGTTIKIFGAKNEVVNFNLVLEASTTAASLVSVSLASLTGPSSTVLNGAPASSNANIFNWVNRHIELFYVRYLQIKGISLFGYGDYYEPQAPLHLRRPLSGGSPVGGWSNRPFHDKFYPDIAAPIELHPTFTVAAGKSQSIWCDVYIPKTAPAGLYTGNVVVKESSSVSYTIPTELTVRNFTLPDVPYAKAYTAFERSDISERYTGVLYPNAGTSQSTTTKAVVDKHFMMCQRHKVCLVDKNDGEETWTADQPRPEWTTRLNGTLYTSSNGYDGPGVSTPQSLFVVGLYGGWQSEWGNAFNTQSTYRTRTNNWEQWFQTNFPNVDRFLYLADEDPDFAKLQQWANWTRTNPGVGSNLKTYATNKLLDCVAHIPSLDISASSEGVGDTTAWNNAYTTWTSDPRRKVDFYNGMHPGQGCFDTDGDGTDIREVAWGQYKKGINRWFLWLCNYYTDPQAGRNPPTFHNNLFHEALTFGSISGVDNSSRGETGWNYSNGEAVLFYPGTDLVFPADNYGIPGPIASLRLKYWRRGLQDVDYINMAKAINPSATAAIVSATVPKALWEYGVDDPADPSYTFQGLSWSADPDVWEAARKSLADIIAP